MVNEQYAFRRERIAAALREAGIEEHFDAVIGRGGLIHPTPGGVYPVNEKMKQDLRDAVQEHACNLGAFLADDWASQFGCPAYIADPVVVDEFDERARWTGLPQIERQSIFHALNSKAVARRYAADSGTEYENIDVIVAHLGGGISVSAHKHGRVIDVNNALDGEGPFSPERAGTLPAYKLAELCFSGKYTLREIKKLITAINKKIEQIAATAEHGVAVNARTRELLTNAATELKSALDAPVENYDIFSEHTRRAADAIGRILGTITAADVLDATFSQLCLGK